MVSNWKYVARVGNDPRNGEGSWTQKENTLRLGCQLKKPRENISGLDVLGWDTRKDFQNSFRMEMQLFWSLDAKKSFKTSKWCTKWGEYGVGSVDDSSDTSSVFVNVDVILQKVVVVDYYWIAKSKEQRKRPWRISSSFGWKRLGSLHFHDGKRWQTSLSWECVGGDVENVFLSTLLHGSKTEEFLSEMFLKYWLIIA